MSNCRVNHECNICRVPSFSQQDSFIPSTFNAYFTTSYVSSVWVVFSEYLPVADPRNKGLLAFIYVQSNNLDEEFKR